MGRKAALTYEQVVAVMDALQAEGVSATVDRVWDALDRRGSRGTVHKLVKRRRAEMEEGQKEPASLRQLPPDVQAVILAFADQSAATARERIADELLEARHEAAHLADESERLTDELDELREQLAHAQSELAAAEGRAEQLRAELATARDAVAVERSAGETARASLAKLELRLEALEEVRAELRRIRQECEAEKKALIEAERTAAVLAAQKGMYEERAKELTDQLARAQASSRQFDPTNAEPATKASRAATKSTALQQRALALDGDEPENSSPN